MSPQTELRHLTEGPQPGESPGWLTLQTYVVAFQPAAHTALHQIQQVLKPVLDLPTHAWNENPDWLQILPSWFVQSCEPEPTSEVHQARFRAWQSMSPIDKARHASTTTWSVPGWIYWLHPEHRTWHWWQSHIPHSGPHPQHTAHITLAQREAPCPIEAWKWLLKTAGATSIVTRE